MDELLKAIHRCGQGAVPGIITTILRDHNLDLNVVVNDNGDTPLMLAVRRRNFDLVDILLHHGAHVDIQNNNGSTALMMASRARTDDLVTLLISYGANLHLKDINHNTALHYASTKGCSDIVKRLIDNQIDINSKNSHGNTALHNAVEKCRVLCVAELLKAGAQMFPNNEGLTPLDISNNDNVKNLPNYGAMLVLLELRISENEISMCVP